MDDFKWPAIMLSSMFAAFAAMVISVSYKDSVEKPALQKLQQECIQEGYGKIVDGKFKLIKKGAIKCQQK